MVMVNIEGKEYYMHKTKVEIYTNFYKRQKKNWDNWLIYSGDEGDGKSTIAKQDLAYMASLNGRKFTVDDISFTPEQFSKSIDNAKDRESKLFDEAITGLASARTMSEVNHILRVKAAMCRKKKLTVGIIIPSFFDLDKNIAIHRSRALIHVYTRELRRGFYNYYTKDKKRLLYIAGKKFYNMAAIKPEFRGDYGKWTTVNEDEYEDKKDKATEDQQVKEGIMAGKTRMHRDAAMYMLNTKGITQLKIAEGLTELTNLEIKRTTVESAIKKFKKPEIGVPLPF